MKNVLKFSILTTSTVLLYFLSITTVYAQRVIALTGATDSKPSQMFLADRILIQGENEIVLQGNVLVKDPAGTFPPEVLLRNISCNDAKSALGSSFTVICGTRYDCTQPTNGDTRICCNSSSSFCVAYYAQNY